MLLRRPSDLLHLPARVRSPVEFYFESNQIFIIRLLHTRASNSVRRYSTIEIDRGRQFIGRSARVRCTLHVYRIRNKIKKVRPAENNKYSYGGGVRSTFRRTKYVVYSIHYTGCAARSIEPCGSTPRFTLYTLILVINVGCAPGQVRTR